MDKHSIHLLCENPKYKSLIDLTLNGPQALEKASVVYSCILHKSNGRLVMIDKVKGETPPFQIDWEMYLVLKAFAKVIFTTGHVLKQEKEYQVFQSQDVFKNHPELLEFHEKRNTDRQKVFLLSNSISEDEVTDYVNPEFYEPILIEQSHPHSKHKTIPQQNSLNGYIERLLLHYGEPLLIESGVTTLNQYLSQTSKHKNLINLVIIAEFDGSIPEACKGKEVTINFNKYFSCLYTSEPTKCLDGHLVYSVYGPKIQQ